MKICTNLDCPQRFTGHEDEDKFCWKCGSPVREEATDCAGCGKTLDSMTYFCPDCGVENRQTKELSSSSTLNLPHTITDDDSTYPHFIISKISKK